MADHVFGGMNNPHRDLIEEVSNLLEMNMEFIELTVEWPLSWVDSIELRMRDLKDELESYNAFVLIHSPYYLEVAHPYDDVRSGALRAASKILRIASELESAFATFHPFTPGWLAAVRDKARELNVIGFRELIKEGRELGVQILVENVDHGAFRSPPDIRYLLDNVEGLLMTLDLGHAMMNGGIEKLRAYLKKCGRDVMHLHAHDNDMNSDLHMPIGAGRIPWREVAVELTKGMYRGTITLEVHSSDPDYLRISREKLSSILDDVKDVAGTDRY
ncbi:MAG: sugar phosphate isomerase/epimerase family protein [Candidatus Korarchaeum sp.]